MEDLNVFGKETEDISVYRLNNWPKFYKVFIKKIFLEDEYIIVVCEPDLDLLFRHWKNLQLN